MKTGVVAVVCRAATAVCAVLERLRACAEKALEEGPGFLGDARRRGAPGAGARGGSRRRCVAGGGRPAAAAGGVWTRAIGRDRDPRRRRVDGRDAVHAETAYAVAACTDQATLPAIEPRTGRT